MKKGGFSLIEVVVAVVILTSVISVMIGIFWQGFNAGIKSQERTVAHNLAKGIMEQYSDWATLPAIGTYPIPPVTLNNITYTPQLAIAAGPIYPNELKRIDVTMSWRTENYTLTTLKANY